VDVILTGWVLEVVELMDSECRAEICSRNVYCGIWDVMDKEQLPFVDMPLYIFIYESVSPLLDIATMLRQYSGLYRKHQLPLELPRAPQLRLTVSLGRGFGGLR